MEVDIQMNGIARVLFSLLPVIISLSVIVFFLVKGKKSAEFYSYVAFEIMIFLWLLAIFLFESLLYLQHTFNYPWFDIYRSYVDIFLEIPFNFIHFTWILFVLLFTENRHRKNRKLILSLFGLNVLLFGLAMIAWQFLLKGEHLSLVYRIFAFCAFPAYAEFFAGTFLLFRYSIKQFGYARRQAMLVMLGALLPVMFRLLQDIGGYFFSFIIESNILGIAYLAEVILISIAVFRYRFLNILPIALRNLVDSMQPATLIIDMSNRVADINNSFRNNFSVLGTIGVNADITVFTNIFKDIVDRVEVLDSISNMDIYYYNAEIGIKTKTGNAELKWKYYTVNIQPVITRKKKVLGRIIVFNDVTEYKTLLGELNEKNIQLVEINKELREYAATVEELTMVKERNRFARDIHDTIGHTLTLIIALLRVVKVEIKTNLDQVQEKIGRTINVAREGLQEIKCSVAGLTANNINIKYLIEALEVMSDNFKNSGIGVDLDINIIDKSLTSISPLVFDAVCKLYKEILTNSLKHGKASKVVIKVELTDILKIEASDNGMGCKNIVKGFGLAGMEERVADLKGSVRYRTDDGEGFNVSIELPAC